MDCCGRSGSSSRLLITRQDGIDFLRLAPEIGIVTQIRRYPLRQANQALADLRAGRFEGAAVLLV
jgi:propanol-preferring alcohol dehydrogenase